MTLELVIGCGLYRRSKFMPIDVQAFPARMTADFVLRPGIDREFNEDHAFCIEEEENFVEPVHNLGGFVPAGCLEVTLFNGTEAGGVDKNADDSLRSRQESFLSRGAACQDTDIGSMLEQFELGRHTSILKENAG